MEFSPSMHLRPQLLHPGLGPSAQEGHGTAEASPEDTKRMFQGLELLCHGDRLEELELFNLGKRRFWRDLRAPSSA